MEPSPTMPLDVFRHAPVAMLHEDLSDVVPALRGLGVGSEQELREALTDPSVAREIAGRIRILDVNDRLVELLGGDRELRPGGMDEPLFALEWGTALVEGLVGVWKGEGSGESPVALLTRGGERRTGLLKWFAPPTPEGPDWRSVVLAFVDTTERDRLADVVGMVSEAEQVVLAAPTEEALLAGVCRIAVERGFLMAWAGFAEGAEPHRIVPVATAGGGGIGADGILNGWDESPLGSGPTGVAVRTGVTQVVNEVATDPRCASWSEKATKAGAASVVALPLIGEGVRGVLGVSSADVGAFGEVELQLLGRLARNVTLGIEALRNREELERARASLEGAIEEKDRFLASIAHEFRTPLASVLGFAEILQQGGARAPEEVREFGRLMLGSAQELGGLVEDLLIAAREHPDSIRVAPTRMDLSAEATLVLERMGGLRVPLLGAADVVAEADPARVRQVLRNLLTNAERYGGDHIELRLGADGDRAWVEVGDDGPELDPEHAAAMFGPYVQAGSTSPEPMGLGLFISRRLAERMGGTLEFARIDGWNTFRLSLPFPRG